ncbi:hypothetical protein KZX46_03760 (plasmid) [Polymorphobacter sp. PAMC 29334]|uniref:hypothetical protein n=1 Tax=Polymorphobacter sp. PAMC 29334 TaxID=2862331 RepID=UPI001C77A1CA|nr:hypothetical protein [Polymorphobacter sp. PAMC 29334]QYE33234.1 hypothetical protein KZX46_03760 [Polymorphobacter sp. PAMC 29334]
MTYPLPDLSAPDWTPLLAGLLEATALAIGRLDARVSGASTRWSWVERASWIGFTEARRGQGAEIDEIDIFALACGVAVPGRGPPAFAADEHAALAAWQAALARPDGRHWRELIPVTLNLPPEWSDRPALLRALELTAIHARADRSAAPWLGIPSLLKALGVTRTPLPCLVAADKALRYAPRDRRAIVPRYLKALTKAAEDGLERLNAVEGDRTRAAATLGAARRPGKLVSLVVLLQRRPLLSPLYVSRTLGLTISGAGKLLTRAAHQGLVVEISGRQAWRAYLAPDLAVKFGFAAQPAGRPSRLPEPDARALARFDDEMAEIDAMLAALGVIVELTQ